MDISTDFTTQHFWQNKSSRIRFIYLVLVVYYTMLEEIYKKKLQSIIKFLKFIKIIYQ